MLIGAFTAFGLIAGAVAAPAASAHEGHDDPHIYEEGYCDFTPSSYKKLLASRSSPGTTLTIAGLGVPGLADVVLEANGIERATDTDGNSWFNFESQDDWVGANSGYLS